jgi:hypothetical protein
MSEEKIAIYTFVFTNSGISLESPLIIGIGQTFEYWGLMWKVTSDLGDNNLICEKI